MNLADLFPNWNIITAAIPQATGDTLLMIAWSTLFTTALALPWGVANRVIAPGGLRPIGWLHQISSFVINIGRAMPFIILAAAVLPFTRLVVGTGIGWQAAIVPVTLCSAPFYARLIDNALREVSPGKVEAALMSGASRWQVATGVLVRESLPGIVGGLSVTMIALISCTAVAGALGCGGLGFVAMSYGYARYMGDVMLVAIVIIVAIVEIIQLASDFVVARLDHRR